MAGLWHMALLYIVVPLQRAELLPNRNEVGAVAGLWHMALLYHEAVTS